MAEADRFQVLDADNVTDHPRCHQLLQLLGVAGVAQHVRDGEDDAVRLHCRHDLLALLRRGGHRLLEQEIVAQSGKGNRRLGMQRIGRGDDDGIGEAGAEQSAPVRHHILGRNLMRLGQAGAIGGAGFGHTHHLRLIGMQAGVFGIALAALTGADDEQPR